MAYLASSSLSISDLVCIKECLVQDKLNCQVSRNRLVYGTTHAAIKDIVVVGIVLGRCVEGGSGGSWEVERRKSLGIFTSSSNSDYHLLHRPTSEYKDKR